MRYRQKSRSSEIEAILYYPDLDEILADNDKHSQVLRHGSGCP